MGSSMLARGLVALAVVILSAPAASGQLTRIRDLTVFAGDIPVRMVGYGLVIGLDATGDRVIGGFSSGHTVRSVANLLRRFDIEVPENMLRTRNVAAVLVTAELSPYLRPGGRFDVHVASIGDATSLRGGVLWITPLQSNPADPMLGTAQGAVLVAENTGSRRAAYGVETTAILPDGGLLEQVLPLPDFANSRVLYLQNPDLGTAMRIAEAINAAFDDSTAAVEDPGLVSLQLANDSTVNPGVMLERIGALTVEPERVALVIIDSRSGTVVAGGNIRIGEAVVSHGAMTLVIGGSTDGPAAPGDLRMAPGVTVQDVAAALHGVAAPPEAIAQVFDALRRVGAITAQVTVR